MVRSGCTSSCRVRGLTVISLSMACALLLDGTFAFQSYTVAPFHKSRTFLGARKKSTAFSQSSVGIDTGMAPLPVSKTTSMEDLSSISPTEDSQRNLLDMQESTELDFTTKVLNGLLLAVSFGFAAYTILNIDAGMTRGWTQSEIALRIPLDNWLNYESSLADRPIFTKTAINVIIYLLGDWLSQTLFSKKNILDFDASRTLRNGFIGLCFGPLVHEYYQFSDHILPVEGGVMNRLEKILMDQTLYLTVKCSVYIAAVGLLQGDDVPTVKSNVQTKLPDIVLTAWKFWPMIHMVTYGLIPARHRILWVNCVDLVWNAILASMSRSDAAKEETSTIASDGVLAAAGEVPPLKEHHVGHNDGSFVASEDVVVDEINKNLLEHNDRNSTLAAEDDLVEQL